MKKVTHHLGRFTTFFKSSSIFVQLIIIASGVAIIASTATVVAMVAMPESSETSTISDTDSNSNDVASENDTQPSSDNESASEQSTDTNTPEASQTTPQSDITQNTNSPQDSNSNVNQQEPQPQAPTQPSYTDTYPFASNCTSSPQATSMQIDSYGYNKCYSSGYTAYKVAQTFGTIPQNWGSPKQWPAKADNESILRGTTPKLHSVGIQTTGASGWSVWVEAVHDNNTIDISYYNFNNNLAYGTQYNVSSTAFSTYIYFGE